MKTNFYLLFIAIMTIPLLTKAQQIYTFSGTGMAGYTGDGGSSNAARLNGPVWVATDNGNNIYIADRNNNVIRKISASGIIRTYAGTGASGFSGDGSAATAAMLQSPMGITVDASGDVYVADEANNRIRKISSSGVITTVAGTGSAGFSGNGGAAISAQLNAPTSVAFDGSGSVYIADRGNNVIRKISSGGIISTFAGTAGMAGYSGDGGAATAATLNAPTGMAIDALGNLYVTDKANNVIRKISTSGTISTIAGTGIAGNSGDNGDAMLARLNAPSGIAIDASGNIYVADQGNNRIRKISTTGIISNRAGSGTAGYSGDGNNATLARLNSPQGISVDGSGTIFVADNGNNVIRIVTSDIAPYFIRGAEQGLNICMNTGKPLDSMLAFNDQDAGQTESWSVMQAPAHGVFSGFPSSITSTGGTIVPSGIWYTPTSGYSGPDDFTIRISDGIASTVTHVSVTVNPIPSVVQPLSQTKCANVMTDSIAFTSTTPGTIYTWTNSKPSIGLLDTGRGNIAAFTATNIGTSSLIGTITVTPAVNGCAGTPASFTITVKPAPALNHSPDQFVCNGASTNPVNFVATSGAVLNWTNNNTSIGLAASGTGNIPSFTALNSTGAISVATVSITPTANGCAGMTKYFSFNVRPRPTINAIANQTVCNGAVTEDVEFSSNMAASTYSWTSNDSTIGIADHGWVNIPGFTVTNNTTAPVTATFNVVASVNSCASAPTSFTITVKPSPVANNLTNVMVCNGAMTSPINFTSATPGATYSWTNDNTSIGITGTGSGNIAPFTASNLSNDNMVANINVTATANGCTGTAQPFSITVKPAPHLIDLFDLFACNGEYVSGISFMSSQSGTTYTWTNDNTAIGLAANGAGSIPGFTAMNTTSDPVNATISVTPTANGCTGATSSFAMAVNPTPSMIVPVNQVACNGTATTPIMFSSSTSGITYNWTNDNMETGLASNGTGNISAFTATNTSATPKTSTVMVTPAANGCFGSSQTFAIVVNPTPDVLPINNQTLCNGSATTAVDFTGNVAGTTYSWTNNNTGIGLAGAGSGNITSFTATNSSSTNITGMITVTPSANGCMGTAHNFSITVQPGTMPATLSNVIVCNGASTPAISLPSGSSWTNSNTSIGLPMGGTGDIAAFTALNTSHSPVASTINVNYSSACMTSQVFTITVNPTPDMAAVTDQQVCSGQPTSIVAFSGSVDGTAYNWINSNTGIGLIANGTGNIPSFVVMNSSNTPTSAFVTVTPSANGCNGIPQSFTISANPIPALTTSLTPANVCDNTVFTYTPSSTVPSTSFYWSRAKIDGISNGSAFGAGDLGEMLTNNTAGPVAVTYVYTLTAGGCTNTQNVVVNINPTPTLTSSLTPPAICDGTTFSYVPASSVSGVSYSWTRPYVNGINLQAASGTDNPNEKLLNTTSGDVDVTYIYTVTANNCSNVQHVTVTTHPTPMLSSELTGITCSKNAIAYKATSKTGNVAFAWNRAQVANVIPATGSGNGDINETLTNTSNVPVDVMYTYTLDGNGCSHVQYYKLTLNPGASAPEIATSMPSSGSICANTHGQSFSVAVPPAAGTTYTWSVDNGAIASVGNDGQHVEIDFMNAGTATVTLKADGGSACTSTSTYNVTISNSRADDPAEVIYTNSQFIALQNIEDGYQWGYDDAQTLEPVVIPGALNQNYYNNNPLFGMRNYWVMISHNGCVQKSYYTSSPTIGKTVTEDVRFYPNPVNAKINIDIATPVTGNVQVEILNMEGQLVKTTTSPDSKTAVDVAELAPGCYMINCYRDGNKIAGSKFIKN